MKKPLFLLGVSLLFSAANAQVAYYDTSIIKNGNTWLYRQYGSNSSFGLFDQKVRYTVDSVTTASGTLKFNMIQYDVYGTPVYVYKITFSNNSFSETPGPLYGQAFNELDGMALYQGDTVRYKVVNNYDQCLPHSSENVARIGLIQSTYSQRCGMAISSGHSQLLEFNGMTIGFLVLYPSALNHSAKKSHDPGNALAKAFLIKNRVFYVGEKGVYDTRGQKAPARQ